MRLLEQVEHRLVLVLEQPRRDAHLVVGLDSDEILDEGEVVAFWSDSSASRIGMRAATSLYCKSRSSWSKVRPWI